MNEREGGDISLNAMNKHAKRRREGSERDREKESSKNKLEN